MVEALEQELKENPLLEVSSFDEPFSDKDSEADNRNDLNKLEESSRKTARTGHFRHRLGKLSGELRS